VKTVKRQHTRFGEIAVVQSVLLLIFSLILDGGVLLTAYTIPLAAYWGSVIVLSVRVRGHYGAREIAYINQAWLLIVPVGMVAVLLIYRWMQPL